MIDGITHHKHKEMFNMDKETLSSKKDDNNKPEKDIAPIICEVFFMDGLESLLAHYKGGR